MVRYPPRVFHIYCDESYTSGGRYMVYGGIVLPARHVERFDAMASSTLSSDASAHAQFEAPSS